EGNQAKKTSQKIFQHCIFLSGESDNFMEKLNILIISQFTAKSIQISVSVDYCKHNKVLLFHVIKSIIKAV
nr:hypothetical protein [Candidatus Saccharibacteria bacterium]